LRRDRVVADHRGGRMTTAKRAPASSGPGGPGGPGAPGAPGEPSATAVRPPMTRTPFGMVGMPSPQKAKHFKQSARRLMRRLAPERNGIIAVIGLALSSVMLGL